MPRTEHTSRTTARPTGAPSRSRRATTVRSTWLLTVLANLTQGTLADLFQ